MSVDVACSTSASGTSSAASGLLGVGECVRVVLGSRSQRTRRAHSTHCCCCCNTDTHRQPHAPPPRTAPRHAPTHPQTQNAPVLKELKFGIGDGTLQYYLYNWRTGGAPLDPGQVGLILL